MPSGSTIAARTNTVNAPPVIAHPNDVKAPPVPAPIPFIVGVWYQPVSSFAKWRSRGINTLIGIELEGSDRTDANKAAYVKAAHAAGFKMVGDHVDCDWISNGPDEPDGQGNVSATAYKAQYATLKAANPTKPIYGDFDGEQTRWRPESDYSAGYFLGCDVAGYDWYPCNRGMVPEGGFDIFAGRVDWAVRVAAGKPVWVAIETCDQNMRGQAYLHDPANQPIGEQRAAAMRGPTPDELDLMVTTAVQRGAKGIYYFTQVVGPPWTSFDGTPTDVAARMTAVNQRLAPALVTPPPAPLPAPAPPVVVPAAVTPFAWPDVFSPVAGTVYDRRK